MEGWNSARAQPTQVEDEMLPTMLEEVDVNEDHVEEALDQRVEVEEGPTANATPTSLVMKCSL